ncbi:hypothetical protein SARC_09418 [Sphaeroforma arctica JP610]|uniref:HECT-type E3 ubiquitin transferase n=1 Tax=Sphaeroforma arctica JP610 TaxID=667725 RepID=A0A0L0FN27_9EUKA|nr:hypothetical protein SARC_09418 [Sphaeroforma arctica JP610]KNC78139.1 hypothetical protein SARC_09418 [Sphaeroforma arctica JP610]|eukprot:XP_014152041.1 hypothetical protein SARC_09418 [Sphaeroforma arctica JP610]
MPPKRKAKSSPQNQAQRKKHNTQQEKKAEEPQPQVTPDQSRSSMADGKKASLDDAAAAKAPSSKDEDYTAPPDAERSAENSLPNSEPTPSTDATPTRTAAPDASRSSSSGRLSESSRPTSSSKDSLGGSYTVSGNRDSIGGPYRHIVEAMNDWGDDAGQIVAVSQLCEQLSVATEETLTGFPTNAMVVSLVALMGAEYNPDLMLVATRTLTHLLEAKPSATTVVIRNQVVPVLCSKLLMIEYIDLAEQSLTALEKVSHGSRGYTCE